MIIPRGLGLRGIFIFSRVYLYPTRYAIAEPYKFVVIHQPHRCINVYSVCIFVSDFFYLFFMIRNILRPSHTIPFLILVAAACVDHNLSSSFIVECDNATSVSYTTIVSPIIQSKCVTCHNSSSGLPDWSVLSNLQEKGSEIQRRITLPLTDPKKMPRSGSITQEEREAIYCWIQQGALNN